MQCQLCGKRKAVATVNDRYFGTGEMIVCSKCCREFWPTATERVDDSGREEYRAEQAAEIAAAEAEFATIDY